VAGVVPYNAVELEEQATSLLSFDRGKGATQFQAM
jgi:hypothetical protein